MRILVGGGLEEAIYAMNSAKNYALISTCSKSQRGSVVMKNNSVLGGGYNKPTDSYFCNPCMREHIKDNSRVEECCAVHAEEVAIFDAYKAQSKTGASPIGSVIYHIKTKNKLMVPSDEPSCTRCSASILEAELTGMVLWHKRSLIEKLSISNAIYTKMDGSEGCFVFYEAAEYNHISLMYFEKRNIERRKLEEIEKDKQIVRLANPMPLSGKHLTDETKYNPLLIAEGGKEMSNEEKNMIARTMDTSKGTRNPDADMTSDVIWTMTLEDSKEEKERKKKLAEQKRVVEAMRHPADVAKDPDGLGINPLEITH